VFIWEILANNTLVSNVAPEPLVQVMRLTLSVIFNLSFYIGVMRIITVHYLHLYILYMSYEIDHCLLSSPLQSIYELWDWSLFVIFTFTIYIWVMRVITAHYLHLYILYRSYEINHCYLHFYTLYRSMRLISVRYLHLCTQYRSYEIDHYSLFSPLHSILELRDWSVFVIFTFRFYI
jgi:hypothetical protein